MSKPAATTDDMRNEKNMSTNGDFAGKVFNVRQAKRATRRSILQVESNRAKSLFQAKINFCEFTTNNDGLRRRVRFSHYDDVFEIRHIDDMSNQEIDDLWLSRECLQDIREECRSIVQSINEGCTADNEDDRFYIRGLDQHTTHAVKCRKALQNIIYEAVGRVQESCKQNQLVEAH